VISERNRWTVWMLVYFYFYFFKINKPFR
jgi:hypothetical protein